MTHITIKAHLDARKVIKSIYKIEHHAKAGMLIAKMSTIGLDIIEIQELSLLADTMAMAVEIGGRYE